MIQNGWLTTGDLGFIDTDQDLVVTGREKDIIY
jgi:long-subunit acyl-CoA synthetase (AMP-forming)